MRLKWCSLAVGDLMMFARHDEPATMRHNRSLGEDLGDSLLGDRLYE